ncbi:hypothetical protein I79_005766 [Cricetulus griseus]|uniref:Uncharacterized protein n=1 Tax=Cricetulus griseus TaxID=10029 RepID=G3H613_CRIGR|nr:hypothetical protein I79_005766 [Cricetulus griseus]
MYAAGWPKQLFLGEKIYLEPGQVECSLARQKSKWLFHFKYLPPVSQQHALVTLHMKAS